ncbi:hypothetical protein M231_04724, partial [Tremella mesenterica]
MDIARVVRTQVSAGELDPPLELVQNINDGSVSFLGVVKALGEYLTATEDDVRLKGLTFLTNTLKSSATGKVNRQATLTLTRFYISKLDDADSLTPTLTALIILSKLPYFDDESAIEVYKALVENVNMKAHVQAIRHLVYQILDSFLAKHRKALKNMGLDFLNSYVKMVDGEKDPRNLMLLFAMDRVILLEFDVETIIEDFFDITFCYFPVSFRPPPNDPYGITADDLKLALRNCMAATPHFAKMALPLFLEKFPTSSGPAMKDLMLSMAACFPTYGSTAVSERGEELWECVKTEILYSSDPGIESAALSALESLVKTLYPTADVVPTGIAQDIIKQCLEIMNDPEKAQALAATKIIVGLVGASASAGPFAISQTFQQLFRQFNRPTVPSHRSPILWSISSILIAAQSTYGNAESGRNEPEEKSLQPFRGSLMDILREGLRTDALQEPAIRGSVALIEIPEFLGRDEAESLVRGMNNVLVDDSSSDIKRTAIKGLITISKIYSSLIESITFPLLFHNLPDAAPTVSAVQAREKYRSILYSLSQLCVQPGLFQTLVIRITTKLELLASSPLPAEQDVQMSNGAGVVIDARECTVAYTWDLLNCLSGVIDAKLAEKHVDVVRYWDQIIPRIYRMAVEGAISRIGPEPLFSDTRLLEMSGKISEVMTWELNPEKQSQHLSAVYAAFERGQMKPLIETDSTRLPGSPLRTGASAPEQNLIILYSSVMQGLRKDVILPFDSAADFLGSKVHWTINVAREKIRVRWALDLITAFVNQRDTDLGDALELIFEKIWSKDIQDISLPLSTRTRALHVYLHIIKGLALLRNPLAYKALDRVIDILSLSNLDPDFVHEAANSFGILAHGKSKGKDKSHLIAKFLHAQKLWNYVLPKIIQGDHDAQGKSRIPYLIAFSSFLPLIPASLCLSDFSTILPLLLRSLTLSSPTQRINVITCLISIFETPELSTEIDSLLHRSAVEIVEGINRSILSGPSSHMESSG